MSDRTIEELVKKLKEVIASNSQTAREVQGGQALQIGDVLIPKIPSSGRRSLRK